jgi:Tfp pilus assembly protein PilO
MLPVKHKQTAALGMYCIIAISVIAIFASFGLSRRQRGRIAASREEITLLRQRLLSARITNSRLDAVKKLLSENLAISQIDSRARGASMPFLRALTRVLDELAITLVSLEPGDPVRETRFVKTPYTISIRCTYEQLCHLVNKMEKSPRLIAVKGIAVDNSIESYLNRTMRGIADIELGIETLTLVRNGAHRGYADE